MKKTLVSLCMLISVLLLSSCTVTETTYGTGYSNGYVSTTVYGASPAWSYAGYGYDSNWYGGTPDYYSTSVYVSQW